MAVFMFYTLGMLIIGLIAAVIADLIDLFIW